MSHAPQIKIPAAYIRGGPSKGVFFNLTDLPPAAQMPGAARDKLLLRVLNPDSKRTITGYLERSLKDAMPEDCFQFERHGYFVADRVDSVTGVPKFNRAVTLKDSWTAK